MTGPEYHRFMELVKRLRKVGHNAWNKADLAEDRAKKAKSTSEKIEPSMEFAKQTGIRETYRDAADAIESLLAELNS